LIKEIQDAEKLDALVIENNEIEYILVVDSKELEEV
jgi:hypothetical protein